MDYYSDLEKPNQWSWLRMLAAVAEDDLDKFFGGEWGGECGSHIESCWFEERPRSYDHATHTQLEASGQAFTAWALRTHDVVVKRADGSGIRLLPPNVNSNAMRSRPTLRR